MNFIKHIQSYYSIHRISGVRKLKREDQEVCDDRFKDEIRSANSKLIKPHINKYIGRWFILSIVLFIAAFVFSKLDILSLDILFTIGAAISLLITFFHIWLKQELYKYHN